MAHEILYHGSKNIIEKPLFGVGKPYNDYGLGFYCTKDIDLAKEWACVDSLSDGYANKYELDTSNLKILDLTSKEFNILNWMAILVNFREFDLNKKVAIKAKDFLINNYYIDVDKFDIIVGYRADDSYFRFARDFLNNGISLQKLEQAMKFGNIGIQTVLKSKDAFAKLHFIGSKNADKNIYFPKRIARDSNARAQYDDIEIVGQKEIYLNSIVDGDVKV